MQSDFRLTLRGRVGWSVKTREAGGEHYCVFLESIASRHLAASNNPQRLISPRCRYCTIGCGLCSCLGLSLGSELDDLSRWKIESETLFFSRQLTREQRARRTHVAPSWKRSRRQLWPMQIGPARAPSNGFQPCGLGGQVSPLKRFVQYVMHHING